MKVPRKITLIPVLLLLPFTSVIAQNDKYDQQRKLLAGTWLFDFSYFSFAPDRKITSGRNVTISFDGDHVNLEFQSEKGEKEIYILNTDKSGETNRLILNKSTESIYSTTYWSKAKLVREYKRDCRGCTGGPWQQVTETYSVSSDGKTLTIAQETPSEMAKFTGQIGAESVETLTRRYRRMSQ